MTEAIENKGGNKEEQQYLDLIRTILETGSLETGGRNGTVKSIFGSTMRFSLQMDKFLF